jgi:Glycosyltransferase
VTSASESPVLLASGFGDDTGGGIFSLENGQLEQLDRLSSTGLAVQDGQVARLLRSSTERGYGSELLLYDARGIKRYLRIDELADPHDVLFAEGGFVVVSTTTNTVLWLSESGEVVRRWKAPGEGDAWHLNSLGRIDDRLIVSAFGRFESHRRWAFEETRDRLARARVVALPVRENSYSGATTVLLQAMALAKPVVVTRTKAIATGYGLVDGENCRLVPPGDADGFERALVEVLRDEPEARHLGASARSTVERDLTWDQYVDRLATVLADARRVP